MHSAAQDGKEGIYFRIFQLFKTAVFVVRLLPTCLGDLLAAGIRFIFVPILGWAAWLRSIPDVEFVILLIGGIILCYFLHLYCNKLCFYPYEKCKQQQEAEDEVKAAYDFLRNNKSDVCSNDTRTAQEDSRAFNEYARREMKPSISWKNGPEQAQQTGSNLQQRESKQNQEPDLAKDEEKSSQTTKEDYLQRNNQEKEYASNSITQSFDSSSGKYARSYPDEKHLLPHEMPERTHEYLSNLNDLSSTDKKALETHLTNLQKKRKSGSEASASFSVGDALKNGYTQPYTIPKTVVKESEKLQELESENSQLSQTVETMDAEYRSLFEKHTSALKEVAKLSHLRNKLEEELKSTRFHMSNLDADVGHELRKIARKMQHTISSAKLKLMRAQHTLGSMSARPSINPHHSLPMLDHDTPPK